jgi:hypothetical protein
MIGSSTWCKLYSGWWKDKDNNVTLLRQKLFELSFYLACNNHKLLINFLKCTIPESTQFDSGQRNFLVSIVCKTPFTYTVFVVTNWLILIYVYFLYSHQQCWKYPECLISLTSVFNYLCWAWHTVTNSNLQRR